MYVITSNCSACGDCVVACPEDAIMINYGSYAECNGLYSFWNSEYSDTFYITRDCNGCGLCVEVCPAQAILRDNH